MRNRPDRANFQVVRRLHHSRALEPDQASLEGFDSPLLEGDPLLPTADAASSLRPFARDVPEPGLGAIEPDLQAEDTRALRHAEALASQGRRLDAVLALRQSLEDRPTQIAARIALATLHEQGEDYDAAIEELGRVLQVEPGRVDVLVRRGALYARTGQAAPAELDLREALRKVPSHYAANRYLGVSLLRRGVLPEAVRVLREAERLAPQDAEVKLALGEALAAAGRATEALAALERASALAPRDPRPYTVSGRLLDRLGRSEEALAMHRKAREVAGS
jgi:Flp pilus assembly protein TadD